MRWLKAAAQFFLFLAIVNLTFAGIALFSPSQTLTIHEMRVVISSATVVEDVTEASETERHTKWQSEELPESPTTPRHLHSRPIATTTTHTTRLGEFVAKTVEEDQTRLLATPTIGAGIAEGPTVIRRQLDFAAAQSFKYSDDPNEDKFFNKELNRKLKEYLVLGAIAGVITGIANGAQKQIIGTVSPGSQTIGRSVEALDDEHPRDQEDLVSRSLSNMSDKDLQMLSIVSRRLLGRFD